MKTFDFFLGLAGTLFCVAATGCNEVHPNFTTSQYHPGPVVGQAVGEGVGAVGGNVIGVGVGATEGVVKGLSAPFDTTTHVVRRWQTEITPDGRTVQVPRDILVDDYGRPVYPQPPVKTVVTTTTTTTVAPAPVPAVTTTDAPATNAAPAVVPATNSPTTTTTTTVSQ